MFYTVAGMDQEAIPPAPECPSGNPEHVMAFSQWHPGYSGVAIFGCTKCRWNMLQPPVQDGSSNHWERMVF